MTTDEIPSETTVSDRGIVTIPAEIRHRLDIDAGDQLRWVVEDDAELTVEVVRQRYGAFDDLKAVPMCGGGSDTHDPAGYEEDAAFAEDA